MRVFLQVLITGVNRTLFLWVLNVPVQILSLSDTEHGWAHGYNTVYSVIHGLTGTSIELQSCLGMSWYDLESNVARVCTNKARIYSIKQRLSWFEHDLQNDFNTIVVRFQVRSVTALYD